MEKLGIKAALTGANILLGATLYTGVRQNVEPEFPEVLATTDNIRSIVALQQEAVALCEDGTAVNPYIALSEWLPTRTAQLNEMGLSDESFNYCDGPTSERPSEKHLGNIAFSESILSPKWTLKDIDGTTAVFESTFAGSEPVVHRVMFGATAQANSLTFSPHSRK